MPNEEEVLIQQGSLEPNKVSTVITALLVILSIGTRSATSILTPIWLDSQNNDVSSNVSDKCHPNTTTTDFSERRIDPYSIMLIVNFLIVVFLGLVLALTKLICPYLITDKERNYDKREFVLVGISDTLSAICFVYASSGCRTAPYLQALVSNCSVPVTFIIRFVILRKRPTCRKTVCAILVLFAEATALIPDIIPGLESFKARQDQGGASGLPGILWPLCFAMGFLPLALTSIVLEKAVKTTAVERERSSNLNVVYVLFWCYLSSLVTHILMFWTDIIPDFGMVKDIDQFTEQFVFNVKCYFGFAGCYGNMMIVWGMCTALLFVNRLVNSYFLRYLEGANFLVIVSTIQTPVVFLFFTMFDENPLHWHPHAYLSTWVSVAALCIMLPAIYIYDTGAPEVKPDPPHSVVVTTVVTGTQSALPSTNPFDDTTPLLSADESERQDSRGDNYGSAIDIPNPAVNSDSV